MTGLKAVSPGIYERDGSFFTINLVPGESVYGEEIVKEENFEYREWDPRRSKLGAFLKEIESLPVQPDMDVLYLGAGDGTTVSHLSDIVTEGRIIAVEKADKPYRNLLSLSSERRNIYPVLADAREPERYQDVVDKVDFLYQDIAQRDQTRIFLKNTPYLKEDGYGFLSVKSRSIDSSSSPEEIYGEVENRLERDIEVQMTVDIGRWQKDHTVIVIKK